MKKREDDEEEAALSTRKGTCVALKRLNPDVRDEGGVSRLLLGSLAFQLIVDVLHVAEPIPGKL